MPRPIQLKIIIKVLKEKGFIFKREYQGRKAVDESLKKETYIVRCHGRQAAEVHLYFAERFPC